MRSDVSKGWVYIISNSAMPDIIKIGYTTRSPEARAVELDGTSSPYAHIVEYAVRVSDPISIEKKVHRQLSSQNVGKEWFDCDLLVAVSAIRSEAGSTISFEQLGNKLTNVVDPLNDSILSKNKDLEDFELQKRSAFQEKMRGYQERGEKYSLHCKKLQQVRQIEIQELETIFLYTHEIFWPKIMEANRRKDSQSNYDAGLIYKEWEVRNKINLEEYYSSQSEIHIRNGTKFRSTAKHVSRNTLTNCHFHGDLCAFIDSLKSKIGIDDNAEF